MTIAHSAAVDYFKDHLRGTIWNGFGETQQVAALAHAKRVLNRLINANLDEETIDTANYIYRPDYAVYEQALWMLENGVIANGEKSAPGFIASDPEKPDNARDSQKAMIAPETMRWLGVSPMLVLSRG